MSYPHFSTECDEHHGLVRDFGGARPRIVCLCGSSRFYDEYQQYALKALDGNVPPPEPKDPALPAGEYARVEIMGHDQVTGWVTDGMRAGVPVLVIRDWDGRVLREVPGQSLYQFVPLATPLKRPDPQPTVTAIGGGEWDGQGTWMPATDAEADAYAGNDDDESGPF